MTTPRTIDLDLEHLTLLMEAVDFTIDIEHYSDAQYLPLIFLQKILTELEGKPAIIRFHKEPTVVYRATE